MDYLIFKTDCSRKLKLFSFLHVYIVLTISILIGQEPPAYFENSRDFVDKHDYSIICYPIIPADYTARSAHA